MRRRCTTIGTPLLDGNPIEAYPYKVCVAVRLFLPHTCRLDEVWQDATTVRQDAMDEEEEEVVEEEEVEEEEDKPILNDEYSDADSDDRDDAGLTLRDDNGIEKGARQKQPATAPRLPQKKKKKKTGSPPASVAKPAAKRSIKKRKKGLPSAMLAGEGSVV